jgi:RNA polymerase sigma-70 factor (ECF subfamily)
MRRARTFRSKLPLLVEADVSEIRLPRDPVIHNDQLRLIFMCCHPALATEAQVALILRLVCGLSHTAPSGDTLTRTNLAERALDLARLLRSLMPDEREVKALLALLLLNHARRATRTTPDGGLLLLEEQDRDQWDRTAIAEGHQLVVEALRGGRPGRFALQAAIAAVHAMAPTYADTDWGQILILYDELLKTWPSPVVALNRAVVIAMG